MKMFKGGKLPIKSHKIKPRDVRVVSKFLQVQDIEASLV